MKRRKNNQSYLSVHFEHGAESEGIPCDESRLANEEAKLSLFRLVHLEHRSQIHDVGDAEFRLQNGHVQVIGR